jgi:phosphatidylglycerol---prolipoprotein diacylglyceryl transferase
MIWNVSPEIISFGGFGLRWYSLLFLAGFLIGYKITFQIFKKEKINLSYVEPLFTYMFLGTLLGARLGHILFYEPEVFIEEPLRVLKVWEGGLASHGGVIGIVISLYIFSRRYKIPGYLWLLDRLAIPSALAAALIRVGNFFNSEILGRPTDVPWAITFAKIDDVPRHPAQLYEAICYFVVFGLLVFFYKKANFRKAHGFFMGLLLVMIFGFRFFVEFLKEHQVDFEKSLPLDMGQLLSIPFVLVGIFLIWRSRKNAF